MWEHVKLKVFCNFSVVEAEGIWQMVSQIWPYACSELVLQAEVTGCGAALSHRWVLWEALFVALHFSPLAQKLFPHRWDTAVATVPDCSRESPQPMGWLCPGPGQNHTQALRDEASSKKAATSREGEFSSCCCLGHHRGLEDAMESWLRQQTELGVISKISQGWR